MPVPIATNRYFSPGVYIEEVQAGPTPVESAPSAILGIIGFVKLVPPAGGTAILTVRAGEAVPVRSLDEFRRNFAGQLLDSGYLGAAMTGFYDNGGKTAWILPIEVKDGTTLDSKLLADPSWGGSFTGVLEHAKHFEQITILAFPDLMKLLDPAAPESVAGWQRALMNHCAKMKNRVAILDAPDSAPGTLTIDIDNDKWFKALRTASTPSGGTGEAEVIPNDLLLGYGAVYYPWVRTRAANSGSNGQAGSAELSVPPSGHVAGIFARVDLDRGVHRAPANEPIYGGRGPSQRVTRDAQNTLNPAGINCLRSFPGQGTLVWGARTLSRSPAWCYVNVRRLFCHIQDSIQQSTRWVVFEPNDTILWAALRRDIEAYLTTRWREGALFGKSAQEAFFVKCDEETNPPELRGKGFCTVEIGIAAARPAEFLILQISQWEGSPKVLESADGSKPEKPPTSTPGGDKKETSPQPKESATK